MTTLTDDEMKEALMDVCDLVEDGHHYMWACRFVSVAYGLDRKDTSILKVYRSDEEVARRFRET